METINNADVSYDNVAAIEQVFLKYGMSARSIEGGLANDRVDVLFLLDKNGKQDSNVTVMIWARDDILRFRVVLLERKKRDELRKNSDLWRCLNEAINRLNQNAEAFGTLSLENLSGFTLDYNLTMAGGIPDYLIINSTKEIVNGARLTKSSIEDILMDFNDN